MLKKYTYIYITIQPASCYLRYIRLKLDGPELNDYNTMYYACTGNLCFADAVCLFSEALSDHASYTCLFGWYYQGNDRIYAFLSTRASQIRHN
jgi:hypothetical protein